MTLKFYNIKDDPKELTKHLYDTGANKNLVATVTGYIKRDCTIEEPEFEVSFSSDLINANYVYVADLGRYYYITGRNLSTQRIFIKCDVDVRMSFKSGILNMTCVVERQADTNKANHYLTDKYYRTEQRHLIRTVPFMKGGTMAQFTPGASSFVLTTGGKS